MAPGVNSGPVGNRWDTGRTEAFSDGVFAFAITLLVLDLHVPASEFNHLWRGIAHQWPSYLGYATSFLTVGGIWLVHHGILLLMAVAFLPFPTSLVAEAIRHADAERAAVIFYSASLLVISLLYSTLWSAVASDGTLLKPDVSKKKVDAIARATTPNLGFYLAVILLAFIAPKVAAFGYLVIAIVALVRARGDRAPTMTAPGSA
jgi:uncharacterized membrane protein